MIFIVAAKLVILAQPKTGSVALENALTGRADWSIRRPDKMKHMAYWQFQQWFAPALQEISGLSRDDYEVAAIMREPLDWFGSMFRFNSRERLKADAAKAHRFTGDVAFDDFLKAACVKKEGSGRMTARMPCGVSLDADDTLGVDRLYPYEDLSELYQLIETRTGSPLALKRVNVSPERELDLSSETEALFRKTFAPFFDLHASLRPDGAIAERFRSVVIAPVWPTGNS